MRLSNWVCSGVLWSVVVAFMVWSVVVAFMAWSVVVAFMVWSVVLAFNGLIRGFGFEHGRVRGLSRGHGLVRGLRRFCEQILQDIHPLSAYLGRAAVFCGHAIPSLPHR